MSEAVVVNLFLFVRVLIVGGVLLALPRITRKGLLFGVYVGEAFAEGDTARGLVRRWDRGCLTVMAAVLVVGLVFTVFGHPVAGNLTGTVVLLVAALVLYLRVYSKVRALVPPDAARQARRVTASLMDEKAPAEPFAKITFVVCLFVALATLVHAISSYPAMPDRVPSLAHAIGGPDGWSDKSLLATIYAPLLNLVLSPFFALLAWLTATAKRSLREGPGVDAVEAQEAFRATMAFVIAGMALLICALLALFSVQMVRVALLEVRTLGTGIWWLAGGLILFGLVSAIRIMLRYGQGGAVMERRSAAGSLTGGLADNAHWVLGLFYVDRDDPSIMVEKRFGFGYALNYGNRFAVLLVGAIAVLIISLTTLGFLL